MGSVLNVLLLFGILRHFSSVLLSDLGFILNDAFRPAYDESVVVKIARQNSYRVEEHSVKTEDGYILKLFRIPSSPIAKCKRPLPVYLHHGIFECSEVWMLNGPQKAMAYILADAGYDVWMGNARGNTHSRQHESLPTNGHKFWEFTFHEIAIYDNPAVINYILSKTKQNQLHYIGHSQGAGAFFILMALQPEYNDKIKTMHGLAPLAFLKSHESQVFEIVANYSETLMMFANDYGFVELLPNSWLWQSLGGLLCNPSDASFCYAMIRMIAGQSLKQQTPEDTFPYLPQVFPAGASAYQLNHLLQLIKHGEFRFYDFGIEENIKRYGSKDPPEYPLKNITASPIFLYSSHGDTGIRPVDVRKLALSLPKKPTVIEIEDKHFGHSDFMYGKYAKTMVYDKVLSDIKAADEDICN